MKRIRPVIFLLIGFFLISMESGCGGLKGPMIPKSSIPVDADADVKEEIERLYSSKGGEREDGAENLGNMGKRAAPAVPFLIDVLKDKEEDVRRNSAQALGKIGDSRAVEPLIAALKDKEEDVRRNSAQALGKIGDSRAVEPLIAALKDKEEDVRRNAAGALRNIKDPRAVEPLIAALKDKDVDVRKNAAGALGNIKDPRAVEPLIAALNDDYVQRNAAEALGKIGDPRAVEPLIAALRVEDDKGQGKVAMGVVFGGIAAAIKHSVDLVIAKKERDRGERWSIAWAIADIGQPAVEPLIAALKNEDEDKNLRRRCALALGKIGGPRAVEALIAALKDKDEDVRLNATVALGNIGDLRTVEPLIAALKDKDVNVRKSAKEALGKIAGKDFGEDPAKWQEWWIQNRDSQPLTTQK